MKTARIYVDDIGYEGIDLEATDPRGPGLVNGFSSHNMGNLDALKFGDTPLVIHGGINIESHIKRILARIRNRTLIAKRIVIELED